MAGRGSRFANAGFTDPKPLIPVGGKPMIQWVIENVRPAQDHQFTFICLSEHLESYPEVPAALRSLCPGCNIVTVNEVTDGAACTVLLAKDYIDTNDPLMIANADQLVELDINAYLAEMDLQKADGLIMTFEADHPKWSYCRMDDQDSTVTEVVEKQVVSNEATVGIYNFRSGSDYVRAAERMIARNLRVNNEFYVAPTFNQLVADGGKVVVARTGREYAGMYGLGTPEDLAFFKATSQYDHGRVDGGTPLVGRERIAVLTRLYIGFFHSRNLAGVRAMVTDDVALEDPTVKRMEGKEAVLGYLAEIFNGNPDLTFSARQMIADETRSVIEFDLVIGGQNLKGTDIIEWEGRRIKELRAYLY